jgi:hypothetical protein
MRKEVIIAGMMVLLILVSGCTALEKSQDASTQGGVVQSEGEYAKMAPAPSAPRSEVDSFKGISTTSEDKNEAPATEPKIIKNADLQLEVPDVRKVAADIGKITESAGGSVQSSSIYAGYNNQYSGTVTIHVPQEQFTPVLEELQKLGKITSTSVSSDDVTEEYVDLQAQKTAYTNQLAQYNRILTQAVNVSEILVVQREIERVQVELDRITGRMKYLDSRVSFSVITIRLSEPAQVVTSTGISIASVISEGIEGFTGTLIWLVVAGMTLLPLIIIGGLGFFFYRRWKSAKGE